MPLAKSKTSVGLGNALMNDRFGKGKGQDMRRGPQGISRTGPDGQTYITTPKQEASWMKMRSVTEQAPLDEFLSTAQLAGTDFTAEKMNNVKIIHKDQKNPYLLSAAEERATVKKHNANKKRLKVPRRPQWDDKMSRQDLDTRERESLIEWRRGLAELQENDDLLMTPFERNIEVWRQLWRVIERSDLIIQIVDARNPLLFRCEDLENYVKEVDPKKKNLLLVNKADMMTLSQRKTWADYFKEVGINFRFFSAQLAKEEAEAAELVAPSDSDEEGGLKLTKAVKEARIEDAGEEQEDEEDDDDDNDEESSADEAADEGPNDESGASTRIITTEELEALFLAHAPHSHPSQNTDESDTQPPRKTTIGLVGYPNVGKSSTINTLLGAKKVSVSATPGKTKHFQTLHLSERIILCDCPGLVFPNFANTTAELLVSGILPIDQMREYSAPASLVAQRIPQSFLEAIYGFKIPTRPLEEGGTGTPTGEELLRAYATARGFATTGHGGGGAIQPDEPRAARSIFKDYVRGKILFCHPPPREQAINPSVFNRELYDAEHLPLKRQAGYALTTQDDVDDNDTESLMTEPSLVVPRRMDGEKTKGLDKRFFGPQRGDAGHLQSSVDQRTKELSGRKLKTIVALEKGVDPAELKLNSKKHFKGNKKGKNRGGEGTYV